MLKIRHLNAIFCGYLFVLLGYSLARGADVGPVRSEAYVWKNVTIIAGGFMPGIEFDPAKAGLAYIRADMGGAYRWNQSKKIWVPLIDWAGIPQWNDFGIESLAVDPSDPDRVYIAAGTYTNRWAGNGSMLRSSDQGRSWQSTAMPFKMGGNEDGRSMGERMAVDPNDGSVLYFGSRHNGMWTSADHGATWNQVNSFPVRESPRAIGIGFVVFDAKSGSKGTATPTIYAGVEEGDVRLYRSTDAGKSWDAVHGQPRGLMPQHAVWGADGILYISYTNAPGPNNVSNGGLYAYDTAGGTWTDISPLKPMGGANHFGYAGLTVDAENPRTIMVATMDRWEAGDDVFRSVDGGKTWKSVRGFAEQDVSASPFLNWGAPQPKFGWWIGSVEIDPFNSNHVLYVTGATVYGCDDISEMDSGHKTHWHVAGQGIEETAVIDLLSPPEGPHLISALGDVGGFRHDDFSRSPVSGMMSNPLYSNTTGIDESVAKPGLIVRVGSGAASHGAYSLDAGGTWTPFAAEPANAEGGSVAISADGSTILWAPNRAEASYSVDMGKHWTACRGLGDGMMVVADPSDSRRFYALNGENGGTFYVSEDSGASFVAKAKDLPKPASRFRVWTGNGVKIFLPAEDAGLLCSTDFGATFTKWDNVVQGNAIGFGAAAPGTNFPAIFLAGEVGTVFGVFRSDDRGVSWIRINDDAHQYGWPHTVIGDPRIFGRVYLGTNGRGVLYADPAK